MGINATKRVQWKGTELGDYAFVTWDYNGNNEVRIIPKAEGVKIRSTAELGGGYLHITVNALVAKNNRFELEQFFNNLHTTFDLTTEGDLTIADENGTLTLTDCYLESFNQGTEDLKVVAFTFKFIKSL
jgi:hypothetical protein